VLTGGEVAAMALIEGIARLLPGVLGNEASATEESHSPSQQGSSSTRSTRAGRVSGDARPELLLGGNHGEIARYRREQAH